MISNKNIIKLKPVRIRDKLLTKFTSKFKFRKNRFGFYTNDFFVLKDVHSSDISDIQLIDFNSMHEVLSINTKNFDGKVVRLNLSWYEFKTSEHILRINYTNEETKYFNAKMYENVVIWSEIQNITNIVYLDKNLSFTKDFASIIELKYNSNKKKKVILRSFSNDLKALSYILNNDVNIVILTKVHTRNLSAKNLIKRVRKTKTNVKFIIFSNDKKIELEDVDFFDKSNSSSLFEKLDFIIK